MTSRILLRLAEIIVPIILAVTIYVAWQADRRDRAQLATQLAAAQKTISDATASQHNRDTLLNQTLAQLTAQKQAAVTIAQILKDLPNAISLPAPITLQAVAAPTSAATRPAVKPGAAPSDLPKEPTTAARPDGATSAQPQTGPSASLPSNPNPNASQPPDAVLPSADLKPLYDFALDCKACQAKLASSQNDLNDEKTKTATLTKELNAAVAAAKGGSVLQRILRAAKWFALGAAAGAVAAKAAR
ncbi:MAG: hypothetical protein ACRD51_17120 [Candidatus Acidiferrum sp.]